LKFSILDAKLPFFCEIFDNTTALNIVELLILVFLYPLLKVAWHRWISVEVRLSNSVFVLASQNKWGLLLVGGNRVQVHASSWLHGRGHWLGNLLSEVGGSVALNNLNVEINIRTEWDHLTTDWGPGEGGSPDIMGWAGKFSLSTLVELWDRKVPAMEDFS